MIAVVPRTQQFQFIGGSLALDFVNTVGNRLGEPREYLLSPADFSRWTRLAPLTPGCRRLDGRQLAEVRRVRESLYRLFRSLARGAAPAPRPPLLAPLNREIARLAAGWQLERRQGTTSWTWERPGPDSERILAYVLRDAGLLLTTGGSRLIRECQDPACGWLFLDRSRQGNRRWCSMIDCGNRAKARRFYRSHGRRRNAA